MGFAVVNSVKGSKEDIPVVVMEVQRMGLDALTHQPGFKLARLLVAEDGTEAVLVIEWESREHFVAYRQTDVGKRLVEQGLQLHPHISFYEIIAAHDAKPAS